MSQNTDKAKEARDTLRGDWERQLMIEAGALSHDYYPTGPA